MESKLNITCKQASFLISKKQETKITLSEKLKLRMHLAICTTCNLFAKQTNYFLSLLKTKPINETSLSETKKQNLKLILDKEIQNSI